MIIPQFSLDQDDESLKIKVRAPHCDLKKLDVRIENDTYVFNCRPYFLRISLPGKVEEGDPTHTFDCETGEFNFLYKKFNTGEQFQNLKFITALLCTKSTSNEGQRKIEVVESSASGDVNENEEQKEYLYGFALRGGYNLKEPCSNFADLFEIDPNEVEFEQRSKLRYKKEQNSFNSEHYLADIVECDQITELIELKSPWENLQGKDIELSPNEDVFLKNLTNVSYSLNEQQIQFCHNSLLEILFCYCYDRRSTYFESTCESGWTVAKLSSSVCWFDSFFTVKHTLVNCYRRALIYPLHRSFEFNEKILEDLRCLVNYGEEFIIKCLIDIYYIFLNYDKGYYILNNLFIKDYIVYIQKWDRNKWQKTVAQLNKTIISKNDLGLNLLQLEKLLCDDQDESNLNVTLANLTINESDSDDASSDSGTECSESDESDTEDTTTDEE